MLDGQAYVFGPYRLVHSERKLTLNGNPVDLGSRAFDALSLLVSERGKLVTKQQLMDHVWSDVTVDESNLRFQMSSLRRTLSGGSKEDAYIKNVPGRGYVFIGTVTEERASPPALPQGVRCSLLPNRPQALFGRDQDLRDLQMKLSLDRFVSIVGAGGVGKTTVANELVHRLADEFDSDICYADLGSLKADDLVLPTIAVALGYKVQSPDLIDALTTFISDRRLLLVLDCCEHVIEEASKMAAALFRRVRSCHILTTSREPLRAYGEVVHILQPLQLPAENAALTAAEAMGAPTVQLFMERARSSGYSGRLEDKDAATVSAICRQLDGNPLAIELAGSRLTTYGFAELLKRLDGRAILNWPGRRHEVRHQSLEATLDWSFELLSDYERQVITQLSVFVGPFSLRAAAAILDGDEWRVARAIEELVDKSLVAIRPDGAVNFYRLLDVTRVYAETKLRESGGFDQVARRHALYFVAEFRDSAVSGASVGNPVGNLRAALEWCFCSENDLGLGIDLAAVGASFFLGESLLKECLRWCQTALHHLGDDGVPSQNSLKLQQSLAISMMYTLGNADQVGSAIERGLELAVALGDREAELHLLAGQNLFLTRRADYLGALRAAQRFAALAHASQVSVQVVASDWMLGSTYNLIGKQKLGQQLLEQGTARAEALGIHTAHYFGFDNRQRSSLGRAWTSWLCGQPEKASNLINEVITQSAVHNHPVSLCITHLYGANVVLWLRELNWAERLIGALADVASKYNFAPYETGARALQGELLLGQGYVEKAVVVLENVLEPLRTEEQYIMLAPANRAYAECLTKLDRLGEAESIIVPMIDEAETTSPSYLLPELLRTHANIHRAAGRDREAEATYLNSIARAKYDGAVGWELRTALSLARFWIAGKRNDQAERLLEATLGQFSEGFGTGDLREARQILGRDDVAIGR